MSNEHIELGQMFFASNTLDKPAPDFTHDGLRLIAQAVKVKAGDVDANFGGLLTDNSGEPEYSNPVFTMRCYCWCDGDRHPRGCPPNFEHHPSGLSISWYKYALRGRTINRSVTQAEWIKIVRECLESI
jgi:hypothetical protein